ncbi:SDR family oxidoreductase [Spiroplasma taiwanense]|uniref:Oxidoreductase n=1 Tax=Spiroplasma taiwanense CT-1 TaxID=1276220 RepID=S5LZ38_9MOLU|nr:SDR family oxidoreductase [Spiroplasma taiwanense]AGR40967.1 oxidoreductase [Spiroplasma taiwanense CT-1]
MKKLVVITGASSGIGMQLAKKFAKEGHPILLLARRKEKLLELEISNAICESVDVKNFNDFKNAIDRAEKKYGDVDLLINNAGIMPLDKIYSLAIETQHEMVDINVKGVLNGINIVIKKMKEKKTGTIINVSSVAGRWTSENRAVYNGTKFAVHAISEQTRKELAPFNVRVLTVAPALVDTNLINTTENSEIIENYYDFKNKLEGGLTAEQVANIIIYMYNLPQSVSLKEVVLSSTQQEI